MTGLSWVSRLVLLLLVLAGVLAMCVWIGSGPPPPQTQEMDEAMPALQAK